MAERITVVPDELRQAALAHRATADRLSAASSRHADVMATLESLGPVFADLREAGRELLEQRRQCYRQQAAAHDDLADTLCRAAQEWERHEAESAQRLGALGPRP